MKRSSRTCRQSMTVASSVFGFGDFKVFERHQLGEVGGGARVLVAVPLELRSRFVLEGQNRAYTSATRVEPHTDQLLPVCSSYISFR